MNATQSCNDVGFGIDRGMRDEQANEAINDRADNYAFAWLSGKFDSKIDDGRSLADLVSDALCDWAPGDPSSDFRQMLGIVQRAARGGDVEAGKLIERMAHDHASAAYERGALL
jgi:hypothetical protein